MAHGISEALTAWRDGLKPRIVRLMPRKPRKVRDPWIAAYSPRLTWGTRRTGLLHFSWRDLFDPVDARKVRNALKRRRRAER